MDSYLNHSAEYNRMIETAKKRAVHLRNRALDDVWSDGAEAARRALRAATRYAASLARHARTRRSVEA